MIRIEIDLNVRARHGYTRASLRDIHIASVAPGVPVVVFEPDENVEAPAIVRELSRDGRFAYLEVDWDRLHEATGVLGSVIEAEYASPREPSRLAWSGLSIGETKPVFIGT